MNKNLSFKKEADKLMQIEGNVKGEVFRTHQNYIRYREGEEGVRKVEEKLKELGYPLKFEEIRSMDWYPEALSVLVFLTAREVFNWTDSDIFDMGNSAPKYSLIVRLLMKYFLSPRRAFEESPKYWRAHYDFGTSEAAEFSEREKYLKVRMKGYKFHPIVCIFYSGYFLRLAQFVIKSKKITIEETKCSHKGDPCHEYIIKWE